MRAPRSASLLSRTLLLGALLVAAPPPALAQPAPAAPPPAPATSAQQADDLFAKGKALLKEGKKQESLESYRAAWKLRKSYDVAGNLGSLEMDLGLYRDAAEHLTYAVTHYAASGTTKDQIDKARQRLEAARKEVCALRVAVNVEGAEVLVDGVSIARAPIGEEVFVTPGARSIEARFPGHVSAKKTIDAKKGTTEEVKLDLQAQPAAAVTSGPTASVVTPPPPPSRSALPAFLLGGAALVTAGVGVGLTVAAADGNAATKTLSDDIRTKSGTCVNGASNYDARCPDLITRAQANDTMSRAGVGLFIGAGALVGGAVLYLVWPGAAPVKLSGSVQPGTAASVQIDGSF